MSADSRPQRISIGFHGGQVLGVRVAAKELAALERALEKGGEGWHELPVEDGSVRIDLGAVVYLRTESEEMRVGFGVGG
jgi:hypothetical protein